MKLTPQHLRVCVWSGGGGLEIYTAYAGSTMVVYSASLRLQCNGNDFLTTI